MLKSTPKGYEEKTRVWQTMREADRGDITYEVFRSRLAEAVNPINVRALAVHQQLSHDGLCIRGGVVEKFLTRLKIID